MRDFVRKLMHRKLTHATRTLEAGSSAKHMAEAYEAAGLLADADTDTVTIGDLRH